MRATVATLVLGLFLGSPSFAQVAAPGNDAGGKPVETGVNYDQLTQVPLTEAQINSYIEAMADMQEAIGDTPSDAAEPDAKTMAKLDEIAKKHGFKNFDDYNNVAGNISLTLDGIDPQTKTFVGADKLIDKSIAEVKADKQMKEADRTAALADLERQKTASPAVKFPGNIELVVKNYDKLTGEDAR